MHRLLSILVLLAAPIYAMADLADEDSEELCGLLDSFGFVMTKFESPNGEGRPLCYTRSQRFSIADDGYEFSYRVISHFARNHPDSLFLQVQGIGSKIPEQESHALFTEMSKVVLSRLFTETIVSDTVLAIQSLAPGYNRHMTVRGYGIQLAMRDYTQHGYPQSTSMRLDIRNVCNYEPTDMIGKSRCLAEYDAPQGSLFGDVATSR